MLPSMEVLRELVQSYRRAVEDHIRAKFALIAYPELERQIAAPLLARHESRVQAAEIQLMSAIKRRGEGK